ncbi:MAG: hypothetical protein KF773_20015 [Deltaproteobacteria bacterium]|nr:hypothetical protein [Deltaproteobacteria bacterium]
MRKTFAVMFVCALAACGSGGTGGGGDPKPDAANNTPRCGDGVCLPAEVGTCPADCGSAGPVCGNSMCEAGETTATCPADCQTSGPVCGDNICDMAGGENNSNCPGDCTTGGPGNCPADITQCLLCAAIGLQCPPGLDMNACNACIAGGGGFP